jgi:hypothetical protein
MFESNSLFYRNNSLFAFQNSLFRRVGNSLKISVKTGPMAVGSGHRLQSDGAISYIEGHRADRDGRILPRLVSVVDAKDEL